MPQRVKCLSTMRETRIQSLVRGDLLEKEMAPHSSILAWKIPWMEEPGRLQSIGSQWVRHNWMTSLSFLANNRLVQRKLMAERLWFVRESVACATTVSKILGIILLCIQHLLPQQGVFVPKTSGTFQGKECLTLLKAFSFYYKYTYCVFE